jgi:hypothetical protein
VGSQGLQNVVHRGDRNLLGTVAEDTQEEPGGAPGVVVVVVGAEVLEGRVLDETCSIITRSAKNLRYIMKTKLQVKGNSP